MKLDEVMVGIERWEQDVRRLEVRFGEPVGPGVRCNTLKRMVPTWLEDRITSLGYGSKPYDEIKSYILSQVFAGTRGGPL